MGKRIYTDEQRQAIIDLTNKGWPVANIMEETGVTRSMVIKYRAADKTHKDGVMTTKGFVKHLQYKGIHLPVKVRPANCPTGGSRPPMIVCEFLVFALPGGGDFISNITVDSI
jgi:hypothetical protein